MTSLSFRAYDVRTYVRPSMTAIVKCYSQPVWQPAFFFGGKYHRQLRVRKKKKEKENIILKTTKYKINSCEQQQGKKQGY